MGLWFAMANITHLYGKNRSGGCVMLLDPLMTHVMHNHSFGTILSPDHSYQLARSL